jgi:hypothetical protein
MFYEKLRLRSLACPANSQRVLWPVVVEKSNLREIHRKSHLPERTVPHRICPRLHERLAESYNRSDSVTILLCNYLKEESAMEKFWLVMLLLGSFLLAQESNPSNASQSSPKTSKGEITVQGCVGRSTGITY